jgi:putative oxidoreductase
MHSISPARAHRGPTGARPMTRDRALLLLRIVSGGVFVAFGLGKFINHSSELASFEAYGLPAPGVFVVLIGVIELVGGMLVLAGIRTRPAALVLAGDMVGAIVVSGVAKGEIISLTLAPAELVAMLVLLWAGPGAYSLSPSPSARDRAAK